jgi:hypothetical protein
MPFDAFMREQMETDGSVPFEPAYVALECIAISKRILLQERVRDFTAADVVALAIMIEARDRSMRLLAVEKP